MTLRYLIILNLFFINLVIATNQNIYMNISTQDFLYSSNIIKVNEQLKDICIKLEHYRNEYSKEKYSNILGSVKTHAFLFAYADALASLREANVFMLQEQLKKIWPARPSQYTDEELLEKLNRNLFVSFDAKVAKLLEKNGSDKIPCADFIVEYAENVIENFVEIPLRDLKAAQNFVAKKYNSDRLKSYLSGSWMNVYNNVINSNNSDDLKSAIQQLSNGMCYPVRKGLPVATTTKTIDEHKINSRGDFFARANLSKYFDKFINRRCRNLDPNFDIMQYDAYLCIKNDVKEKSEIAYNKEFCKNFWPDFRTYYISKTKNLVPAFRSTIENDDKIFYEEVFKTLIEPVGFMEKDICPLNDK